MNRSHAQAVVTNIASARTHEVTHFHDACEWTGVRDNDRDAWLALRHSMITASDVAAIMGDSESALVDSPWARDAFSVYVDKTTPRGEQEQPDIKSPMFWGKVLEEPIARAVAGYYGWQIRMGGALLRSRHCPDIGCTLDAEIIRSQHEGPLVYEGKTSRIPKGWSEEEGNLPTHILIQAQVQLLVTQAPRCIVFGLLQGSRPVQIPVEPYPEYHAIIVEQVEWIMDLIRRGEPPTPTSRSGEALRRLYPGSNGETARLPIESVEWTKEVQAIAEQIKAMESRKEELGNMLRAAIGPATYGELPEEVGGKRAWKWGVQANGNRPLIAVKNVPGSSPVNLLSAPVELKALPEAELIGKYTQVRQGGRRRSRR